MGQRARRGMNDYDDIPGTFVFDAERARRGYPLNRFCMSLMRADNRAAFKADEAGYVRGFGMSEEQIDSVLTRNWNRMLDLGANVYFMAKLFFTDGISVQFAAAQMSGMTQDAYAKMMLAGGRSPDGNRRMSEQAHG
jgi:protocatechuate 4,5-dioxygenase alpha chain